MRACVAPALCGLLDPKALGLHSSALLGAFSCPPCGEWRLPSWGSMEGSRGHLIPTGSCPVSLGSQAAWKAP